MARKTRRGSSKVFRYFFVNQDLHKVLRKSRGEDLVVAWNYRQGKRVAFSLIDLQKNMQHAYSLTQVSKMLNRNTMILRKYIWEGAVPEIQKTYSLDGNRSPGVYYFSEDDIRGFHDFLLTVHIGRPRKDGKVNAAGLPTRSELEAMLRQEVLLYVKNSDGEFTPVWKQPEW